MTYLAPIGGSSVQRNRAESIILDQFGVICDEKRRRTSICEKVMTEARILVNDFLSTVNEGIKERGSKYKLIGRIKSTSRYTGFWVPLSETFGSPRLETVQVQPHVVPGCGSHNN